MEAFSLQASQLSHHSQPVKQKVKPAATLLVVVFID